MYTGRPLPMITDYQLPSKPFSVLLFMRTETGCSSTISTLGPAAASPRRAPLFFPLSLSVFFPDVPRPSVPFVSTE